MLDVIRHLREIDPYAQIEVRAPLQTGSNRMRIKVICNLRWRRRLPKEILDKIQYARANAPRYSQQDDAYVRYLSEGLSEARFHIQTELEKQLNENRDKKSKTFVQAVAFKPFLTEAPLQPHDLKGGRSIRTDTVKSVDAQDVQTTAWLTGRFERPGTIDSKTKWTPPQGITSAGKKKATPLDAQRHAAVDFGLRNRGCTRRTTSI